MLFPPDWEIDDSASDPDIADLNEPTHPQRPAPPKLFTAEPMVLVDGVSLASETSPACVQPTLLGRTRLLPDSDNSGIRSVRNTFIDAGPPPLTPQAGAFRRRTQSLPKDLGSDKDFWETFVQRPGQGVGATLASDDGAVLDACCQHQGAADVAVATPAWLGLPEYVPATPSVAGLGLQDCVPVPTTPSVAGLGFSTPTPLQSPAAAQGNQSTIIDAHRARLLFGLLQQQQHLQAQSSVLHLEQLI
jgi:hypothetical protein